MKRLDFFKRIAALGVIPFVPGILKADENPVFNKKILQAKNGDIRKYPFTDAECLPLGTPHQVLTISGGTPEWKDISNESGLEIVSINSNLFTPLN